MGAKGGYGSITPIINPGPWVDPRLAAGIDRHEHIEKTKRYMETVEMCASGIEVFDVQEAEDFSFE